MLLAIVEQGLTQASGGPPSWVLADEALAGGAKGNLFGSRIAPGGINLVLYSEMLSADDALTVYDPAGALPKTQDSWR